MHHYQVWFVEDSQLPSGCDFAFVSVADETYLFMKRSAIDATTGECEALTRSFCTWQRAHGTRPRDLVAV